MASVLHGSARTTAAYSMLELQASKESARSLAARYDLNPKTVRKWRHGPRRPIRRWILMAEEHGADAQLE